MIKQLITSILESPNVNKPCTRLLFLTSAFLVSFIYQVHADVVINEIHYHPANNGSNAEFVELYNNSDTPVNVSNWYIDEGIQFTIPEGTIIDAHGYLVICRNELFVIDNLLTSFNINTVGNFAESSLSNDGEELILRNHLGQVVDQLTYNDSPPWPQSADGAGASLELVHPAADNSKAAYWKASIIPTPGEANSQLLAQAPPIIQTIQQSPKVPTPSDAVQIDVTFINPQTIQSVELSYRVNAGPTTTISMIEQNGHYSVTLPAQTENTLVTYWVSVRNNSNFELIEPAGAPNHFLTFQSTSNPVAENSVIINEVMYNNPDILGEDQEYIELFNPTNQTIDLSYWQIKDQNDNNMFRIPNGTTIPSGGYLLFADTTQNNFTGPVIEGFNVSLSNSNDEVRLFDPNTRLISAMEYNDNGEYPVGADGTGRSLELLQTTRSTLESNNWGLSSLGGSPGKVNDSLITDENYQDYNIVINELFYNPEDEEYDNNIDQEYIELYNRGDVAIDISGWFFSEGIEYLFPEGTIIPAKDYLLVARNVDRYPDVPNKVGNYVLRLSNGGEDVGLSNRNGVVIDYVDYNDSFPWPAMADGQGRSLELISPWADNNRAQFWRSGNDMSPGTQNTFELPNTPPRITDVDHSPEFPNAIGQDAQTETETLIASGDTWQYFKGTSALSSGWTRLGYNDSDWEEGPSGFGYGDDDDETVLTDMRNNYLSVFIRTTFEISDPEDISALNLRMDYDDAFVAYINGVEVARANISGNPPRYNDSASSNHEAGTFEVFNIALQDGLLREGENLIAIQGHNVNLTSSDFSLIPELESVTIIESQNEEQDDIIISAEVEDPDGVAIVRLHYQRLFSPPGLGLILGDWVEVEMVDDGTNGDAVAGDSTYSFRLNSAEEIRPGEVWRYRISADDSLGNTAEVPLQNEVYRNFAFYVEDANQVSDYPTTHLFIENRYMNELLQNPETNAEKPSIIVIDGEVFDLYHDGGVRFRGNVLRDKPKKSWKVEFPKGHHWNGQREINLNSNYQTSPLVRGESGFIEHMAYELFRDAGYTVPDTMHRRLVLNNSYYGLFLQVEQYNKDFVDNHNLLDGQLIYKAGVDARPSFMTPEPNRTSYERKYEFALGKDRDIQPLIDFIEGIHNAEDKKSFYENHVNINHYIDYVALLALLSHVDSTEKNYFPARGADGRWFVYPWDMSHAWGEMYDITSFPFKHDYSLLDGVEGGKFGTNYMRHFFLTQPDYADQYYQRLRYYIDTLFNPERLNQVFDNYWNYIEAAIAENAQRWNSPGELDQLVPQMKQYVQSRIDFILEDPNVRPENLPTLPVNIFPADDETVANRTTVLQAEVDGESNLPTTQWVLQIGSTNFHQPIWSQQVDQNSSFSVEVPEVVLAPNQSYFWRMRWKNEADQIWSDWSEPTSFNTGSQLPVPDVKNILATPLDESVRLQWDPIVASDLLRVDVYNGNNIVESAPIHDNLIRITGLENGQNYLFTVFVVSKDRRQSRGVFVQAIPQRPLDTGSTVAYFRFENNLLDETNQFTGTLRGNGTFTSPGAKSPIPLNQAVNEYSLDLTGNGNGVEFGSSEMTLDVITRLTLECYVKLNPGAEGAMVFADRIDETGSAQDAVWRFGSSLHDQGTLDFFFNDTSSFLTTGGRLHVSTRPGEVPADGEFYHYAAVVDLNENSVLQKVKLYRNGAQLQTRIVHDDGISEYNEFKQDSDLPVIIGAKRTSNGLGESIDGAIDEFRMTNATLTPNEMLDLASATFITDWMLH